MSEIDERVKAARTKYPVMQFFRVDHLPEAIQPIVAIMAAVGLLLCEQLPDNLEKQVALRRLMETKEAAVRAMLYQTWNEPPPEKNLLEDLRKQLEEEFPGVKVKLVEGDK